MGEMGQLDNAVKRAWWKESSVYQIYPASFKDSNGDGIGDLPGIYSKLDYIHALNVDIIWLCPIYKSPQVDMGYDISDYYQIHAPYGTVADVDRLIEGCHERGMKFVMGMYWGITPFSFWTVSWYYHKTLQAPETFSKPSNC